MDKHECQELMSNVIIINKSSDHKGYNTKETSKIESGVVVLMIAIQKKNK